MPDYTAHRPNFRRPISEATPEQARAEFAHVMANLDSRLAILASLVGGEGLRLDLSLSSVDGLEAWYVNNVEPHDPPNGRLASIWYGIAFDIGLYLGEVLIRAAPVLRWQVCADPVSDSFQRHVVGGINDDFGEPWYFDPWLTMSAMGHQVIDGKRPVLPYMSGLLAEMAREAQRRER